MRTTTLALAILACGTLPAQDIGLTLGGSTVRPQSIEGLDIPRTTSVLAGASVRYGLLDVGVTFRPEVESKFGGNAFEWSYTAANIQAGLPLHRSGDYMRQAHGAARDLGMNRALPKAYEDFQKSLKDCVDTAKAAHTILAQSGVAATVVQPGEPLKDQDGKPIVDQE